MDFHYLNDLLEDDKNINPLIGAHNNDSYFQELSIGDEQNFSSKKSPLLSSSCPALDVVERNHSGLQECLDDDHPPPTVSHAMPIGGCIDDDSSSNDEVCLGDNVIYTFNNKIQYACIEANCEKVFSTQQNLRNHLKSQHYGIKKFQCDICGRNFSRKYVLDVHRRSHTAEKPYKCTYSNCSKAFASSGDLSRHQKIHTNNSKSFQCSIAGCTQNFRHKTTLDAHIRRHLNEKPFTCKLPECGKAFATLTNYQNHLRVHSNERPFICEICQSCFKESSVLNRHIKVHSNPRRVRRA